MWARHCLTVIISMHNCLSISWLVMQDCFWLSAVEGRSGGVGTTLLELQIDSSLSAVPSLHNDQGSKSEEQ